MAWASGLPLTARVTVRPSSGSSDARGVLPVLTTRTYPLPRPGRSRVTGRPTVAIAHDYLTQRGGAERVVLALHRAFPEATIHTTLYDPDGTYPEFRDARIETSPLNRVGRLRRSHRAALPFLAPA